MNIKPFSFSFKVEKDNDLYHAWCPESGCHSHGKTKSLALENLKDGVQLYLDTLMEEEIARLVSEQSQEELSDVGAA
jgi:predicted RNase H-like HicB family nuclease